MPWDDEAPRSRDKALPGLFFLDEEEQPARSAAPAAQPPDVFVFDDGYAGPDADRSELPTDSVLPTASRLAAKAAPEEPPPMRRFDFDRGFGGGTDHSPGPADPTALPEPPPRFQREPPSAEPSVTAIPALSADEPQRAAAPSPARRDASAAPPSWSDREAWAEQDEWERNRGWSASAPKDRGVTAPPAPAPVPAPRDDWEDEEEWSGEPPPARDPWTDALHDSAAPAGPPRGDLGLWDEDVSEEALPPARLPSIEQDALETGPINVADDPFGPGGALDAAFGRAFGEELPTADPVPAASAAEDPWDNQWRSPQPEEDEPASGSPLGGLRLGESSLQRELEERPLLDPQPMYLKQLDSPMLSQPPPDHSITGEFDAASRMAARATPNRRLAQARPELVPLEEGESGAAAIAKALLVASFMGVLAYASSRAWVHFVDGQPVSLPLSEEPALTAAADPDAAVAENAGPGAAEAAPTVEDDAPAVAEVGTPARPPLPAPPDPEPAPPATTAPAATETRDPDAAKKARASRAEARAQGVLTVLTDRPADVWVDGRRVGRTPMRPLRLAPGWHDVRVVAATGRRTRHDARTRIDSGQARHLALEFASIEKQRRR